MAKRPNFFLLCEVKPAGWNHRLTVPVPLFIVDDLLDSWPLVRRVLHKCLPNDKIGQVEQILQENGVKLDMKALNVRDIKRFWRKFRNLGRFTLVDVESEDVLVKVKLL